MSEKYTREEILRKVEKIRMLIDRGESGEAAQARRTLDNIMEKYNLDESVLEEREMRQVPHAWEMRHVVKHIAWALEFELFTGGRWKDKLFIKVTSSEWAIFDEVFQKVKKVYLQKKKSLEVMLEGYMAGFLDQSYPISKENPDCPKCAKKLQYSQDEHRYFCECGFKGKKHKVRHVEADAYFAGAKDSGRLLE